MEYNNIIKRMKKRAESNSNQTTDPSRSYMGASRREENTNLNDWGLLIKRAKHEHREGFR